MFPNTKKVCGLEASLSFFSHMCVWGQYVHGCTYLSVCVHEYVWCACMMYMPCF